MPLDDPLNVWNAADRAEHAHRNAAPRRAPPQRIHARSIADPVSRWTERGAQAHAMKALTDPAFQIGRRAVTLGIDATNAHEAVAMGGDGCGRIATVPTIVENVHDD